MEMFVVVFVAMLIFVLLMAVGLIFARKPITGSCGGMSAIGMETACDVCGGDQTICETENKKASEVEKSDLAYDASQR